MLHYHIPQKQHRSGTRVNLSHNDGPGTESSGFNGPGLDGAAALMSSLCLVHCLLLPLAFALSPVLAVGLADELLHGPVWVHWLLIALAAPVSIYALWRGAGQRGIRLPWILAALGFTLMAAGALAHDRGPIEPILTVIGGVIVAYAHWRNWKARKAA